ncbi:hypothetical protein QUC31_007889 [Theobroma cacao]|uniref:Ankyrin repeat-containing protein At2g01680 n=1 Tax=Theobroma cacao TaxID=3641 RepID=A0AB32VDB2_THECC|nr:PREDICTED: ankyrin repeat-containing protein At2g01680 [Theobroma cacao]
MDIRLFDAAQTGNIDSLHQLLRENALLFDQIALFSSENPLHIAYTAGHFDFVKKVINLKPDFAKEVNKDGFSLMHMAAFSGHLEIVSELMKVDPSLCRLQGTRDMKTPFHFAAIKGRVNVINEMLSGCAECIEDVTLQRETAFHLAVKCSKVEAVSVLVHWISELKKEDVLNVKDKQGNTVLHLATWRKQRKVIELLLDNERLTSGLLDVNAANQSNLSALDMLLLFPSEAGDREIMDILSGAGALRARDVNLSPRASLDSRTLSETNHLQPQELVEYFKFKKGRDSPSEARGTLLIIATLVAAATFQVALNPPGGIWQDNYFPNQNDSHSATISGKHLAGWSILGTSGGVSFSVFAIFNSIGFSVSLYMIKVLTRKFPLEFELGMCMLAMFFSYNTAMINISPDDVRLVVIISTVILTSITPLLSKRTQRLIGWIIEFTVDKIHRII